MSNCYQLPDGSNNGGIAAGAAAGALFCLMGGTGHLVVRILYGVMIFAVVGVISFTVAQYGSLNRMNRDLALLNRDLDPEAFCGNLNLLPGAAAGIPSRESWPGCM